MQNLFAFFLFQIRPCPDEFVAYLLCHLISEAVFDAVEHLVVEDAIHLAVVNLVVAESLHVEEPEVERHVGGGAHPLAVATHAIAPGGQRVAQVSGTPLDALRH